MIAKNLKEWHREVCGRDGYKCQICGKDFSAECFFQEDNRGRVNQMVCGDHIETQGAHPESRLDTRFGKCVCFKCHTNRHKGIYPENFDRDQYLSLSPTTQQFPPF